MNDVKKVLSRFDGDVQVIVLNGRLTYDYMSEYKESLKNLIKDAEGYIIDLRGVEQIDSTGLGMLVNAAKHFISNRNKMVIVNKDPLISELFVVSKLDKVFEICNSINEALRIVEDKDGTFWSKVTMY